MENNMRTIVYVSALALVAGCVDSDDAQDLDTIQDLGSVVVTDHNIQGVAYKFGGSGDVIANATVCIVEDPNQRCTVTDRDGKFAFYGIRLHAAGQTRVTLRVPAQRIGLVSLTETFSNTFLLDTDSIEDPDTSYLLEVSHLQLVTRPLYSVMYTLLQRAITRTTNGSERADTALCNIALTVTDRDKYERAADTQLFLDDTVHGLSGATVSLWRWAGTKWELTRHAPIYMDNGLGRGENAFKYPNSSLRQTTSDGGAFFYNLQSGLYAVTAEHPQHRLNASYVDCAPGRFFNVNPPQLHVQ